MHPDRDDLKAFGLGKLAPGSAATIQSHVETCLDCRRVVAESSGDSFLGRLRAVQSGGTPLPQKSLDHPTPSLASTGEIPPELAALSQYEGIQPIGEGGMGVVYRARNNLMDRMEVLKVVNRSLLKRTGAAERFLREIQAAAKLQHPNVVAAYTALQLGELLVFSMEYVPGHELGKLVKSRGPLPPKNAAYYAQQVAHGLQHAHEKGMIHRDIKPANLMLSIDPSKKRHLIKILDFGLAKASSERGFDAGLTGENRMLGTPDYIAPEQILDAQSADIRADIYSLGCTIYYLLTGEPPFHASNLYDLLRQHREVDARPLNLVRPDVPVELADVVAKMMTKDPAKRFQTPADAAKALAPFVSRAIPSPARLGVGTNPTQLPQLTMGGEIPQKWSAWVAEAGAGSVPSMANVHAVPVPQPSPTGARAWETLSAVLTTEPEQDAANGSAHLPIQRRKRIWMWPLLAVGFAGIVLATLLAGGVFKVKTKQGTIVLENMAPDAEVSVDGERVTVTWARDKRAIISVKPGTRTIVATVNGIRVLGQDVSINDGEREVLVAKFIPKKSVENGGRFVSLFNGKDLTGWKTSEATSSAWHVENGLLIGRGSRGQAYLHSERDGYKNIHVKAKVRIRPDSNGGLFVRANNVPDQNWEKGYEVDICTRRSNLTGNLVYRATDSLYNVISPTGERPQSEEWIDIDFIAEGHRLRILIDGRPEVDHTDIYDTYANGRIGLQVMGAGSVIEFQSIEVRELPASVETTEFALAPQRGDLDRKFVRIFTQEDPNAAAQGHGITGGRYIVTGSCAWNVVGVPKSFAIELVGKVKGEPSDAWGLNITNTDLKHGIMVLVTGRGEAIVRRGYFESDNSIAGPIITSLTHPAVSNTSEYNRLLVIIRDRMLEVYLNGIAAVGPTLLDRDVSPAAIALTALQTNAKTGCVAEFQEIAGFSIERMPSFEQRQKKKSR